jgi:hypothetical protein
MWFAWTGIAHHEKPDYDCVRLLLDIQKTCERVIVTDEIDRKYRSTYDTLKNKYPQGPKLLHSFNLYFRWKQTKKVDDDRLSRDLPPLNDESEIDEENREFARLAKLTSAVLVTHDGGLIRVAGKLGFKAMTPSAVLCNG